MLRLSDVLIRNRTYLFCCRGQSDQPPFLNRRWTPIRKTNPNWTRNRRRDSCTPLFRRSTKLSSFRLSIIIGRRPSIIPFLIRRRTLAWRPLSTCLPNCPKLAISRDSRRPKSWVSADRYVRSSLVCNMRRTGATALWTVDTNLVNTHDVFSTNV